jgi:hypothetical protein
MLFEAYTSTKVLHTSYYYIADGGNALTMGGWVYSSHVNKVALKIFPHVHA